MFEVRIAGVFSSVQIYYSIQGNNGTLEHSMRRLGNGVFPENYNFVKPNNLTWNKIHNFVIFYITTAIDTWHLFDVLIFLKYDEKVKISTKKSP